MFFDIFHKGTLKKCMTHLYTTGSRQINIIIILIIIAENNGHNCC